MNLEESSARVRFETEKDIVGLVLQAFSEAYGMGMEDASGFSGSIERRKNFRWNESETRKSLEEFINIDKEEVFKFMKSRDVRVSIDEVLAYIHYHPEMYEYIKKMNKKEK